MHLRFLPLAAVLLLSTGSAFADSPSGGGSPTGASTSSGVGGGAHAAIGSSGLIAGGAAAGGIGLVLSMFKSSSHPNTRTVVAKVPEISPSGSLGGLVLLLGGAIIIRGEKRERA